MYDFTPHYITKFLSLSSFYVWLAASKGQWGLVKNLIANGADINAIATNENDAGKSVLWLAASQGQWEIVKDLIARGANIHATATVGGCAGMSVLWLAASQGRWELAEYLLARGANIHAIATSGDHCGKSILWLAASQCQWELAEYLLARGANIHATATSGDHAGISVLWLAAIQGMWEQVEYFITNGADIHATATSSGYAGISVLWSAARDGQRELVEYLIDNGVDINATATSGDYVGISVLWNAINIGLWEHVEYLIDNGCDIHATAAGGDFTGTSALLIAASKGQWELVKSLIAKGADIHAASTSGEHSGKSVLWFTAFQGMWELVKYLIDNGADIHTTAAAGDFAGISLLWLAASQGQWEIVKDLIARGANIHATATGVNLMGITILSLLAFHNKLNDILPLMLSKNNSNNPIAPQAMNEHAKQARNIASYKINAPFIDSIYSYKDIPCALAQLAQTEQGFLQFAKKIFSHICDDENAILYDGGFGSQQRICKYLINIGAFYQKQTKYKQVSDVFKKAEHDLLVIEHSHKCSNNAAKIKKFFTDETIQMLAIHCPTENHSIIAKFIRKNDLFLYVYNDGHGVNFGGHKKIAYTGYLSSKRESYADSIAYRIPTDIDAKKCYASFIKLLTPGTLMTTQDFYKKLKETTSSIKATGFDDDLHFSTNQRGNTCSLKSIRAFLQGFMSREEYLLHKFATNVATLNEYYNLARASNKLLENMIAMQIIGVCDNIERLAIKTLKFSALFDADTKQFIHESIELVMNIKRNVKNIQLSLYAYSTARVQTQQATPTTASAWLNPRAVLFSAAVVAAAVGAAATLTMRQRPQLQLL